MTIWNLEVERLCLVGARVQGLGATELRALVEVAVRNELGTAPLPSGRAMKASVRVKVPSLASGGAVASAVASGVLQAVGGRARG